MHDIATDLSICNLYLADVKVEILWVVSETGQLIISTDMPTSYIN